MDCCCALKVANGDCNIIWFSAFAGMTIRSKASVMYLMVLTGLPCRLNNLLEVIEKMTAFDLTDNLITVKNKYLNRKGLAKWQAPTKYDGKRC